MGNKNIFTEEDLALINKEFDALKNNLIRCKTPECIELVTQAFKLANKAHMNMRRRSGEPYIIHPIKVAQIVNSELGLGAKSIAAALLHDVVEDTDYTLEDIEKHFGQKITSIIDGLTKISGNYDNKDTSQQAENFRKMLLTLSDDIRVILIKTADRLHNMRTLDSLPERKKMKVAGETIYLYAPLAHRLGLFAIKTELEDLSLKYRHPKIFDEISRKLKHSEKKNQAMINRFSLPVIARLEAEGLQFDITGRPKSIYSIWKKMQTKNVPFEEIYDILAVRIIFEPLKGASEKTTCWNIYSIITDVYMPKPDRLRDWVSRPKANGYEALHLTVMGPHGRWVEVQIRSKRMDEYAERGYAAHWKYKGDSTQESELDKWIKKIREMLESPNSDPIEFLDEFKMNLFSSEIMVFTPKGNIITLPKGASALDFAYEIHTEIGNKAIGAKINYKLKTLNATLQSGDQVEIITSDKAKPVKEWLDYVTVAKAKAAIKHSLRNEIRDLREKGLRILEEKLRELKVTHNSEVYNKLLPGYECLSREDLYSKIGNGTITLDNLKKILRKNPSSRIVKYWELRTQGLNKDAKRSTADKKTPDKIDTKVPYLIRESMDDTKPDYEIAKCCKPIPGDEVVGYLAPDGKIIIHKPKCPAAVKLMSNEGNRLLAVKWTIHKMVSFLAQIHLEGIDRLGVVNDITNIISGELSVNMRNITITVNEGIFEGTIDVYIHHTKDLNNLIMKLVNIEGVDRVKRIEDFN
ncbi:MAG: bifunctional (p)ppGpp synthetase/guanosine-3',5'-bis(diphosphate) 3'-pyrophosphohydrolase [Bacteroidales bacterium]|nr:bifunctional (p)ppGpp synthetase/guanosine-3',5'-bis(diphosphate) 3'-pyrophosphohydrolase [Bacteroidales bacterium]